MDEIFSRDTFHNIEAAFESCTITRSENSNEAESFGNYYYANSPYEPYGGNKTSKFIMAAICLNIIRNKGKFLPNKRISISKVKEVFKK